ncbi:unnamed protein product, partial [Caretta caretta]
TINLTIGSSPTTAENEKQFRDSTECDKTHFTDISQPALSNSKKKKKKRKSPSHYLEQGVHSHQNQQYKETEEERTFKSAESESMQKSAMQIGDTYSETCQKRAMTFHVRNGDGSINSNKNLCPENDLCKIHMSDGGNALDVLKQEDFTDEVAEYSLETYVQNWLQNTFPNAVLPPKKLAPINKKEGNVANSKISKWLYGRQIGSLTNADTSIMKEVKYLLQSDFQHDTKLQVFNEMHENDKKKLQSEIDTRDISPNQRISAEDCDAVSNLQESTSNNLLHSGSRIEKQDSVHCHENPFIVEIQNMPNFHESENSNKICIPEDTRHSEENADLQELTEEFECSDVQKDLNASAETSDLNDLNVHKILSERKYVNANSNNCSLTSNVELSEENEEEADSSLQESQDKTTDTSFNNEESGTSEEPNSTVHSITSNDKDNILDLEISEVEDKKDIMHLGNNKNAGEQDGTEKPNECYKLVSETSCTESSSQSHSVEEKKENGTCEETPERLSTPSPLSFSYESKQITELDITEVEQKLQVKLLVKELEHGTCSDPSFELKKCSKSPATSDWSDYRPDTDDSDYNYRASSDFTNESGEEAMYEKQYNTGYVKRAIEQLYGKAEASFKPTFHTAFPYMSKVVLQKDAEESQCTVMNENSSLCQEHNSCFVEKMSRSSLISHESLEEINKDNNTWRRENFSSPAPQFSLNGEKVYHSDNYSVQCTKQYCQCGVPADDDEGILIDKGKWLLKENHLVRRSPPENTGMYGNLDTTSADTMFDNNSDDVPYSHFANLNQYPPHSEISSSEPEDTAKPSESGCNYFIMPHNSDSEPFLDLSLKSKPTLSDDTPFLHAVKKENNNLSFTTCTTSTNLCTEANTNYPAFTSVEFRLPDNKVHPLKQPLNDEPIQAQPTNDSNANRGALEEQDSLDKLHAICGQHCLGLKNKDT